MSVLTSSPTFSGNGKYQSVNDVRRTHGLAHLEIDQRLQSMANEQAALMARHLRMKHTTTIGQSFTTRLKRVGYVGLAAENLAEGYKVKSEVMDAWMRSAPHRRNMLNSRMRRYGFGVAETDHPTRGRRKYWTLVLGG